LGKQETSKEKRGLVTLEHDHLTARLIGASINVHKQLGPRFVESIYEYALTPEVERVSEHKPNWL
jgi:hypothetical protein